ncbi:hypothetical protein ETH_00009430 [Eimeria tenella]|uniref:Major facilitator superfamily domain-containing protein n=1 Tax=Eimeria tenella TaxID=5802 RepID=U6KS01_EIMTE|nr:hypothetical protein ETH_00009430 [Eimeria tenella]CDJ38208.1 hypothetical protein ETH_00009430 [Eimeria tenella]|eukprot:XP_013229046.1 hypothetical protein ETH_00009430 [Eimeria tenella]
MKPQVRTAAPAATDSEDVTTAALIDGSPASGTHSGRSPGAVAPATVAAPVAAAAAAAAAATEAVALLSPGVAGVPQNSGTVGDSGVPVQVLRVRGRTDMDHILSYVSAAHNLQFRSLEKQWGREATISSADSEYVRQVQSQPRPLNAPRMALLLLFMVAVFIRGCTYWGWNGMQDMLYKSGAYAWLCEEEGEPQSWQTVGSVAYIDCPSRKNSINNLYTSAFAANFIFSAAGGLILDRVGPKLTLLGAIALDAVGWGLLAGASDSFVSYIPALVFIGMAADPGYFSLLCVSNLFPQRESTVLGVMGSVRSLSFAMPVIMAEVYKSASFEPGDLWKVLLFYICVGLGVALLVCIIFTPWRTFWGAEDFRNEHRKAQAESLRKQTLNSLPLAFFQPWLTNSVSSANPSTIASSSSSNCRYKLVLTPEEYNEVYGALVRVESSHAPVVSESSLCRALSDPRFLFLLPIFVVNLLRVEFYTKSNKEQMALSDGSNLYALFSAMNILSFIPGPLMGVLSDRYGVLSVLVFINFAGMFMYALLLPESLVSKGFSVVFFWVYASFVLSSIYCYIKAQFPNKLFGSLAGLCSLVGGCFALTSIGWYTLSTDTLADLAPRNFWVVDLIMVAGGLLVCCVLGVLIYLDKKQKKQRKHNRQLELEQQEQELQEREDADKHSETGSKMRMHALSGTGNALDTQDTVAELNGATSAAAAATAAVAAQTMQVGGFIEVLGAPERV